MHAEQQRSISKLKKQGYKEDGANSFGQVLLALDEDGLLLKRTVDIHGRVSQYLPTEPTENQRRRLLTIREG